MNFIQQVWAYILDVFSERLPFFPSNIRVSLLIILFCLIAVFELYIFAIIRRIKQSVGKKREVYWTNFIGDALAEVILYDESDKFDDFIEYHTQKLKQLPLHKTIVNKLLTREILIYHKNFTGVLQDVLEALYRKLGLDNYTKNELNNLRWEVKIEGIREASEMNLTEYVDIISSYTDDEESLLRMEAQAAYVKLANENPFKFLDRAQEHILDWHQVVLFEVITKNKDLTIPSFSKWLKSSNDTVVMLCLKLVEHYMQFDAANDLERLLKHHSPDIVKKTIQVIGTLEIESAEKTIFEIFFNSDNEIKIEILKTFGKIASGNYEDFLSSRIYSKEYGIKKEALNAIKLHPNLGVKKLKEIYKIGTVENRQIINHILDDRILT